MYRDAKGVEFGVFFLPARSHVCEKVFAEEGVFGDVHIGDYPLSFIPFDSDVLSLELPSSFKARAIWQPKRTVTSSQIFRDVTHDQPQLLTHQANCGTSWCP